MAGIDEKIVNAQANAEDEELNALTNGGKRLALFRRYRSEPRVIAEADGIWAPDIRRVALIDELRGVCVLCMVCYHSFFILDTQFGVAWSAKLYEFLRPAQPIFAGLFIVISGVCARLSQDIKKRGLVRAVYAALITFATVLLLPALGFENMQVWFGVLHLLAASALLFALGMKAFNRIPAPVGALVCLGLFLFFAPVSQGYFGMFGFHFDLPESLYQNNALAFLGFYRPDFAAWDHFPLLPWFFLFLFGTFIGKFVKREKGETELEKEGLPEFCYRQHSSFFGFLGRHALLTYLLHIPVFYGLSYCLQTLFSVGKP
ncbi:MAG: DUF1624 domain-containing protein [Firmicutes bacterium]|nr:DUF1624 domain-containing protein [Bacillota bacterium]